MAQTSPAQLREDCPEKPDSIKLQEGIQVPHVKILTDLLADQITYIGGVCCLWGKGWLNNHG